VENIISARTKGDNNSSNNKVQEEQRDDWEENNTVAATIAIASPQSVAATTSSASAILLSRSKKRGPKKHDGNSSGKDNKMEPGSADLTEMQRKWLGMAVHDGAPMHQTAAAAGAALHTGIQPTAATATADAAAAVVADPSTMPISTAANAGSNTNINTQMAMASARHGIGRLQHADSFANLSIVSSLSGDDGQSVSALGVDFVVDEQQQQRQQDDTADGLAGSPPMAVAGNVGSAFRHSGAGAVGQQQQSQSAAPESSTLGLDISEEISLSLSESSDDDDAAKMQSGSLPSPAACGSSGGLPPSGDGGRKNNKSGGGLAKLLHAKSPFKQSRQHRRRHQQRHLDLLADEEQRQSSSSSGPSRHRNLAFPTDSVLSSRGEHGRQSSHETAASSQSAPPTIPSGIRRQLSAHAPLRDRLSALREGVPCHNHMSPSMSPPGPPPRRPSHLSSTSGRSRSTPVNANGASYSAAPYHTLSASYSNLSSDCNSSVASSSLHSVQSRHSRQGSVGYHSLHSQNQPRHGRSSSRGAQSMSAVAALAMGTPPRPSPIIATVASSGGSIGSCGHNSHNRIRSTASITSHSSYASVQSSIASVGSNASSTMHGSLPPTSLVLGDGRVIEGVKRRDAHDVLDPQSPLGTIGMAVTPSPELLAGRPKRNALRRSQSASSSAGSASGLPSPVSAAGSEDLAVRRAIADFKERDDAAPVQSMREAELRKATNVVKQEIKYKFGKMVPNLHRRASSFSGGGNEAAVQLQRASGCLT